MFVIRAHSCKFAQRVAQIKNDANINEELDPNLIIARLKGQIASLKEEVAFLKGCVFIRNPFAFAILTLLRFHSRLLSLSSRTNKGGDGEESKGGGDEVLTDEDRSAVISFYFFSCFFAWHSNAYL